MKIKELKSELKVMALKIKEHKAFYKDCQRGTKKYEDLWRWTREQGNFSSHTYRHMHIAYCLLRGKKYEQIENKVKNGNEPSWATIESIMKDYREVEEIRCAEVVNV
jgi:hypothetical protein